ncbi:hypothetical protein P7C70_g3160, partial [Phenoliferia sp. Uapishka_3]
MPDPLPQAQLSIFTSLAQRFPTLIRFGCSKLEHDGPALYAKSPANPSALAPLSELMHIHLSPFSFPFSYIPNACCPTPAPTDQDTYMPLPSPAAQSIHITLSPKDAVLAIERGWALRHPASGSPPRPIPPLPKGMVLVFAPRDAEELEVMRRFCEASAAFGAGTVPPLGEDE